VFGKQLVPLGGDSSQGVWLYGVEWDDTKVRRPRIITCHPPSRHAAAYGKAMGRAVYWTRWRC
jgi:hypothetical protein